MSNCPNDAKLLLLAGYLPLLSKPANTPRIPTKYSRRLGFFAEAFSSDWDQSGRYFHRSRTVVGLRLAPEKSKANPPIGSRGPSTQKCRASSPTRPYHRLPMNSRLLASSPPWSEYSANMMERPTATIATFLTVASARKTCPPEEVKIQKGQLHGKTI